MIPTKQTVTVYKKKTQDAWGVTTNDTTGFSYKCRIDMSQEKVRNQFGDEVISKAEILIKGLVNITYSDLITWIDEFNVTYSFHPVQIDVTRDFVGKPIFTRIVV